MKCKLWGALAGLLLASAAARADSSDIEHRCTALYPSMTQYFAWKDCIKTETEQERKDSIRHQLEELKRATEEEARPCIAGDISRMEGLATKIKATVLPDAPLEEVQAAVGLVIGGGQIQIANDNIKERVFVTSVPTRCNSTFRFLINVREDQNRKLRWLQVWAENAPSGYESGLHPEFGADFEAVRQQARWRAEEAKRSQEIDEMLARKRREDEERYKKFLQRVKISNITMKCLFSDDCSSRSVDFLMTNVSQEPVKQISFGWMFLPSKSAECPSNLATKETAYQKVLQPGEKSPHTISILNAPTNRDAKFCLAVTGLRGRDPWDP